MLNGPMIYPPGVVPPNRVGPAHLHKGDPVPPTYGARDDEGTWHTADSMEELRLSVGMANSRPRNDSRG